MPASTAIVRDLKNGVKSIQEVNQITLETKDGRHLGMAVRARRIDPTSDSAWNIFNAHGCLIVKECMASNLWRNIRQKLLGERS